MGAVFYPRASNDIKTNVEMVDELSLFSVVESISTAHSSSHEFTAIIAIALHILCKPQNSDGIEERVSEMPRLF
jgi:hypothetical protein